MLFLASGNTHLSYAIVLIMLLALIVGACIPHVFLPVRVKYLAFKFQKRTSL